MKQSALMFSSFNITVNFQSQLWRPSLFASRHMMRLCSDLNKYSKQHLALWEHLRTYEMLHISTDNQSKQIEVDCV